MFKRIREYFAGVDAPHEVRTIPAPPYAKVCPACGVRGHECFKPFKPSEPVLSILRAVKTRRKTILLASDFRMSLHTSVTLYGFADTITGRTYTVGRRHSRHRNTRWEIPDGIGLTEQEIVWLVAAIERRIKKVQERAAALAGAKARRELMQEYVK